MNTRDQLPLASQMMEQHALEIFPLDMAPEEFAARDGAGWLDFALTDYRFNDPKLDDWIHSVGAILRDEDKLQRARDKYLSEPEKAILKRYVDDDLEEEDDL